MAKQRTIRTQATIRGIGIQTGGVVKLKLDPAPPDSGIVFVRTDLAGAPTVKVHPSSVNQSNKVLQRTVLRSGKAEVHTVEHLLAALSGFYVDNLFISIDNAELPGLDGSAKEYARVIKEAGIIEQDAPKHYLEIEKPIICSNQNSSIQMIPDDNFHMEYFLDYDHPFLKKQWCDVKLDGTTKSSDLFEENIAPSRTFCMERDAMLLLKAGLGKGADFSNTLVIGNDGPINNRFRFPDEPARHKVLDLMGDLYVLGCHIKGRIIAKKSGHKLNSIFVKRLYEESQKVLTNTV